MTAPPGGLQILSVLTLSHKVSVMTDFWPIRTVDEPVLVAA